MIELDTSSFDTQVKQGKGLAIIDFWAPWCGPCKMFGPNFEEASSKVSDVTFAKVNIDENQDIAQEFGVMSIPTVLLFKDGQLVDQFSGARGADDVVAFVQKHQ